MQEFAQHILSILKNNGFPQKRVSLPTEKMYEAADKKNLSFNKVLDYLKQEHQVLADIGADKIIFSQELANTTSTQSPEDLMKQAQEMMNKMSPEELARIQEMFQNMSPEQKAEIMKKGKDMGLI